MYVLDYALGRDKQMLIRRWRASSHPPRECVRREFTGGEWLGRRWDRATRCRKDTGWGKELARIRVTNRRIRGKTK